MSSPRRILVVELSLLGTHIAIVVYLYASSIHNPRNSVRSSCRKEQVDEISRAALRAPRHAYGATTLGGFVCMVARTVASALFFYRHWGLRQRQREELPDSAFEVWCEY
ncbi:hypothetical protein KCV05_g235, partial [Aureobasidium melanogenum]